MRRERYVAFGAVVVLLAGALTLAIRSDTYHATKYELHDSGIWGTRESDAGDPVGRLNYEIQSVDMAPAVDPSKLSAPDVVQSDANVVLYSHATNMIAQVAVAQANVQAAQPLPVDSYVGIGGNRGAVFAPGSGSLWITDASTLGSQSYSGNGATKPFLTVGRLSGVVVGADGTTSAYDPSSGVLETISGSGSRPRRRQQQLGRVAGDSAPQITAVGQVAVILDATKHVLLTSSGRTFSLPSYLSTSAVLQQPGAAANTVLVASSQALATVSLHDGAVGLLSRAAAADGSYGPPVAPVALGGCEYGAWSEHGRYVQICPTGNPVSGTIDPTATAPLPVTWRVNRGRAALNDELDGTWVTFDPPAVLGPSSWLSAFGAEPKSKTQTVNGQPVNANCKDLRGPTTTPFDAGVRAGSSVVIPVLQHVIDPSRCHVLAIVAASTDVAASGSVAIADSGRALLFTPAGNQSAVLVNYTVSDGDREATGTVTVHVYGPGDETPPQLNPDHATVQRGHSVTINVLANDTDREGDPIRLLGAHIAGAPPQLQPTFRADGDVTVLAGPQAKDGQTIRVTYSATDEHPGGVSTNGRLDVTVQSASVPPTAAPVFASTSMNARTATGTRELEVDLLANDSVGSGTSLSLVSVQPIAGQRFRILANGELFFTPTVVGDFTTTYVITDGISPATGRLRVRVAKGGPNDPPVAMPDTAQLRSDDSATVDVLDNDSDPDDDVLFVSAVDVAPALAASLQVAIVDHARLAITATTRLTAPVTFGYTITDGMAYAHGLVTVLPPTPTSSRQPPIAHDAQVTVRVNGAAEIPVLANDVDPNGGSLTLDPKVPFTTLTGATTLDPVRQGLLYAHGNTLRFVAPATPGTVHVNYNVTNGFATSTAGLTINVIGADEQNQAPQPPPLIMRVFGGSTTSLTIPLLGVDPENDPVTLVGLGTPPSRGVISSITGATITYRADPADPGHGGTDMFTYWLRDSYGALGEGTVLVAVSPPPLLNTTPVPENVNVRARPGTTIRVAITANDVDADGDPVTIAFPPTKPSNAPQPRVVSPTAVEVAVPPTLPDGTQITFFYAVTDGITPVSPLRGQVIVTVDRHARDIPVAVDDIVPGTRAPDVHARVRVPVLANDFDPAYNQSQLRILPSFNRSYSISGNSIVIPVGTRSHLVSYCIENPEHSTACAFVQLTVANPNDAPPVAVTDDASVSIGHRVTVDVTANDTHAPGTRLRVTAILTSHWGSTQVTDGRNVTFTPSNNAPGYGAVVYQVSDGTRSAEGILYVTVNGNQPPVLEGSVIAVLPGQNVAVSLSAYVVGSSGARDHFQMLGQQLPPGVSAVLSGSTLTVSAAPDAIGQTGSVVLRASNGRLSSRAALFQIIVTQPPAPQASNFTAGPFKQGSPPQSIDVLAHVTDPTGKGLHIIAASVPSAAGSVQWDPGVGGRLRYAPRATFSGQTQIFVTVGDATGAANRQVVATVTVTVYGPPTSPTVAPTVSARTDTSTNTPFFALDWSAGPALANGAAIDHYQVNWSGGDTVNETCAGSGTRCGFSGLSFAQAYTFRVRAVDVYGEAGGWGPASPSQRYDVAPPAVSSATAQFDVTSSITIDLTWTPPNAHSGSSIRFYDVYIGSRLAASVPAPATGARIGGLVTGQPYEFTIKTRNASNEQSDGVTTTPPVRPLAVPTFVPAPIVSESLNVSDSIDVSWPTPSSPTDIAATGGDDPANLRYFVIVDNGTPQPAASPGFYNFSNPIEGHAYQIKLGVANSLIAKTCLSTLSSCAKYLSGTVSFTTYGPPSAVTNLITTANAPQQLSLTFTPGALPPGSPGDLQSNVYLTAVDPAIPGLDLSTPLQITSGFSTPTNLVTGQQYNFTVLACAVPSNTPTRRFCETTSQSTSGTPYGPPGPPSQPTGAVSGLTITWSWTPPDDGCGGCGIDHYSVSGIGDVTAASVQGTYQNYSTTYCVTVVAVNKRGVTGPESTQGCATTDPAPVTFTVSAGPAAPVTTINCQGDPACRWWSFDETGIPIGAYTLRCFDRTTGDYGVAFIIDITGPSWSFVSDGTTGYCAAALSGHTVYAVLSATFRGTFQSSDFLWP